LFFKLLRIYYLPLFLARVFGTKWNKPKVPMKNWDFRPRKYYLDWIPAFAGMTKGKVSKGSGPYFYFFLV